MKKILNLILLFSIVQLSVAQNSNRIFQSVTSKGSFLEVKVNDGIYMIQPFGSKIIETAFIPNGEKYNKTSHAVILKPKPTLTKLEEDLNTIYYATSTANKESGIEVKIQKSPFQIIYIYNGEIIISEKLGYHKSKHKPMDLVKGNIVANTTEKISFNLSQGEALYGGGARALGMNRRGKRLPLYNRAHYGYQTYSELMNFTLPIMVSSKMYIVHFDNAPIGYLDFDSKRNNTLTYETISGRKTYQIIVGNSWLDLIDNYTNLTGKQPMPPRWAFGNFSSRFGYHSQEETEETIQKFKQEKIPVDAIILDLFWFGKEVKGTLGNFAIYKDSFPNMKGMISKLNKQNVKTILITEPFVLTTSSRWDEAVKKDILAKDSLGNPHKYDFYFGNTGLIDIYNPKAEQWFWNRYKEIIDIGVQGIWGDLGEPEVHPSTIIHAKGTADEVHNIYGQDWAKLVYEGYLRDYPNQRPFILMRAGYSGSQRYGLIPWSGDVSRSWGGLQSQPEISLQMGIQGIGYMHSDLGGFAGANLDDELYTRWLQYGVFQPIYRPHAQEDVPSEPVFRSKKAKNLAKQSIELRYQLLPYNYNLAFQNSHKGTPLMRPLFFEEPFKSELKTLSSTYLWGHDFLIAPILKSGIKQKEVYFPSTNHWFDFYTDEKIKGGQTKNVVTKENSIPTYIRAGAFILMSKPMQNTEEYKAENLVLHYYLGSPFKTSEREFYNDDGKTPKANEKEAYEILKFRAEVDKKWLEINLESSLGKNYETSIKNIHLVVHNIGWTPKRVRINGKKEKAKKEKNIIHIPIIWDTNKKTKIKISLK